MKKINIIILVVMFAFIASSVTVAQQTATEKTKTEKTKVEKTRYMSDLASYGISLGSDILYTLTSGASWPFVPNGISKTNDINADCNLLNGSDGSLLWRVTVQTATDWSMPANQIIDNLNHRFARKFPYRNK